MDLFIRPVTYPLAIVDRLGQSFHITRKTRADRRAMGKKEIGDNDLSLQVFPTYISSFLVDEIEITHLVPDRVVHPFTFFGSGNY